MAEFLDGVEQGAAAGGGGKILQNVIKEITTQISGTTQMPADTEPPQNTEGVSLIDAAAFTPTASDSTLAITVSFETNHSGGAAAVTVALFQDSDADAIRSCFLSASLNSARFVNIQKTFYVPATDLTARTYKIRWGGNLAGTIKNYLGTVTYGGSILKTATIEITELGA